LPLETASVFNPKLITCVWNVEFLGQTLKTKVQEEVLTQLESFYLAKFRHSKKRGEGFWPSPLFSNSRNSASGNESVGLLKHGIFHGEPTVVFKYPPPDPPPERLALY
jgi:hypothetical protein